MFKSPQSPDVLASVPERFKRLGKFGAPICRRASCVYKISGEKEYALKCIPCRGDKALFRQARNEEAVMRALIGCPGAVQLLDWEYSMDGEEGGLYLLEDWLTPLGGWLKGRRLSVKGALLLIADVCKALNRIHSRNILHLDVKPGNLFLNADGAVLIGDFGVSMFADEAGRSNARCGTLSYIAPEMYRLGQASPQADVYCAGMTLYELLNGGRMPFETENEREKAAYKRLAGEELPAIEMADKRDKSLQTKLNDLIQRACAYDADNRFYSVREMLEAVQGLLLQVDDAALTRKNAVWSGAAANTDDSMRVTRFAPVLPDSLPDGALADIWDESRDSSVSGRQGGRTLADAAPRLPCDESSGDGFPAAVSDDLSFSLSQWGGSPMGQAPFSGDSTWQEADEDAFSFMCRSMNGSRRTDPFPEESTMPQSADAAPRFCSMCGQRLGAGMRFCPGCGAPIAQAGQQEPAPLQQQPSRVQFSALAPKTFLKGQYSIVHVLMYEQEYRCEVDALIAASDVPVQESRSGFAKVHEGAEIKIVLSSPDVEIEEAEALRLWQGGYLDFNFSVKLPEGFAKSSILLKAQVYADGFLITRLMFTAMCASPLEQKLEAFRKDVLSVFLSYSSEDRPTVMMIARVMSAIYGRENVFIDVDKLRMGEDWWARVKSEIDRRDVLYLCWSRNAMKSEYVDKEWNYAFDCKGEEAVEPFSVEPAELCPVPEKLKHKHFNDGLLYMQKGIEVYALERKKPEQKSAQ